MGLPAAQISQRSRSMLIIFVCVLGYIFEFLIEWPFRLMMAMDRLTHHHLSED